MPRPKKKTKNQFHCDTNTFKELVPPGKGKFTIPLTAVIPKKNKPPIPRRQNKNSDLKKLSNESIVTQNPLRVKASTAGDRLSAALLDHDLTTAVEVLEELGYHDQSTQVFLLGWFQGVAE